MLNKYKDISLTWEGDVTSMSGWARHARALLRPLIEGGASVKLNLKQPGRPELRLGPWWEEQFGILTRSTPGFVQINHGPINNINKNITGGPTVLLTHWETESIPVQWIGGINDHFDELWVPTEQLLDSSSAQIKIPTREILCPIDVDELNSSISRDSMDIVGLNEGAIVFGTVGHWNQRRNMSDVILGYLSEFTRKDNVALVVKTFGNNPNDPNEKQRIVQLVKELKNSINKPGMPEVILLQDVFSEATFNSIINRFSVYVSSSRGDSKDIAMQKACALGRQCVYVDSLVHKDYTALKSDLLYPVGYVNEPVIQMGTTYSGMDYWARPDVKSLGKRMREAQEDFLVKDLNDARTKLSEAIKYRYSPEACAEKLANAIRSLSSERKVVIV